MGSVRHLHQSCVSIRVFGKQLDVFNSFVLDCRQFVANTDVLFLFQIVEDDVVVRGSEDNEGVLVSFNAGYFFFLVYFVDQIGVLVVNQDLFF